MSRRDRRSGQCVVAGSLSFGSLAQPEACRAGRAAQASAPLCDRNRGDCTPVTVIVEGMLKSRSGAT